MTNKNQRFPIFQDFMHFFKFLTDFVDWNIKKGQQGKNVLSSKLFRRVSCILNNEIVSN